VTSHSTFNIQRLVESAKVPLTLNITPRHRLLIVVDRGTDHAVRDAIQGACDGLGLRSTTFLWTYEDGDSAAHASTALAECDVCLLATSRPIMHLQPIRHAVNHGVKLIYMDELTPELLLSAGDSSDYMEIEALAKVLRGILDDGRTLRITSSEGTDLSVGIDGQPGFYSTGRFIQHTTSGTYRCAFPDGEVGIPPVEGTGNGVFCVNASIQGIGMVDEPVFLEIEKSWIMNIQGGKAARALSAYLRDHGDTNSYFCPVEVAIGLNGRLGKLWGIARTDKKLLGAMHISMGSNVPDGGSIQSKTFVTAITTGHTLLVDGIAILRDGVIPQARPE
jgi:2,5-dihydroxypyridine 5,6-dioxygenase